MLNITRRILVVLMGVMLVLAPVAQASVVVVPACAPMMKMSATMDCCNTSCDCTVKSQAPELSVDLPTVAPRFELSLSPLFVESLMTDGVSAERRTHAAQESPPSKDPLYQTYSDYRL